MRISLRTNGKEVIQHIIRNNFDPWDIADEDNVCIFCNSQSGLTKEHVIPKWCFQNEPDRYFITLINDSQQTFNKTAVPACASCNNAILSKIEKHVQSLFQNTNLADDYFNYDDLIHIIRWLETIEYKFHVLEFRRKFRAKKAQEYIPIFRDVPMSIMRHSIRLSPYKALAQLRLSQNRVKRKEKDSRYYSLVMFRSKNKISRFFHSLDNFIFLEFPEYELALFYFYNELFDDNYAAADRAKEIISNNY